MRHLRTQTAALLSAVLVIAATATAASQERTTASYEDWVLECEVQTGPPAQKTCDIAQTTQAQGRNVAVSRIALAHPVRGQPVKLSAQVPVNVSLRVNLRIQTSDTDPGVAAPFERCVPGGCFADFELKDDVIKKFRSSSETGKMTFKSANGQEVTIPVSFRGFAPAFDALAKE